MSNSPQLHTSSPQSVPSARWIGWPQSENNLVPENRPNRFGWFRRVIDLQEIPANTELRLAADSTARLWINGTILCRKVTRYHREHATCEVIDCSKVLRPGKNVVVVLVHNWGNIRTFQRTAGGLAGLWVESPWLVSDSQWETFPGQTDSDEPPSSWFVYPGHFIETQAMQILGAGSLTKRVRFPQIIRADRIEPAFHQPDYHPKEGDAPWLPALVLEEIPWPPHPADVETRGQKDEFVLPGAIVAAGTAHRILPVENDPALIGPGITSSQCEKDEAATQDSKALLEGKPWTISGENGQTRYVTVDFHRPIHGYPLLEIGECSTQIKFDFGYGEIWRSQHNGHICLHENGWLDTGKVVGSRYADRVVASKPVLVELPDERTCRWMTVQIYFEKAGSVTLKRLGMISSQHPFDVKGSFSIASEKGEADDKKISEIIHLCLDHAAVTMTDCFVDTPGREDGQWLEDATPRAELCARWSGDTSLRRLFLRTVAESQNAEGVFHLFPPASHPAYGNAADWQIQWGEMLWEEWRWSADAALVKKFFPHLIRYVEKALLPNGLDEHGLWKTPGVFGDIRTSTPVPKNGVSGLVVPWLITRLPRFAQLARISGEPAWAEKWESFASQLKQAFRKFLLLPSDGKRPVLITDALDADLRPLPSFGQAAHTEALCSDFVTPQEAAGMLDYIFPEPQGAPPEGVRRWNNPTYCERALKALTLHGRSDRALRHLLERYSPHLPGDPANPTPLPLQGPYGGPIPEYWISREDLGYSGGEINIHQQSDDTGSHGWGAVPLLWLHEYVLGVTIESPGGGELHIAPNLCGRKFIRGKTCTPRGLVEVEAHREGYMSVRLPAEVEAVVVPPFVARKLNGETTPIGENQWRVIGPGFWETEN